MLVLVVFLVDVAPPGLGVADEVDVRELFQSAVEAFDAKIVAVVLEVEQERYGMFTGDFGQGPDVRGVAGHIELLFTDDHGARLQVPLKNFVGVGQIRDFVGTEDKKVGMALGQSHGRIVAEDVALQAVGTAIVCRGAFDGSTGGQEDGSGRAHSALVGDKLLVRAEQVAGVLVDVQDGFVRLALGRISSRAPRKDGHYASRSGGQKFPAGEGLVHGLQWITPVFAWQPAIGGGLALRRARCLVGLVKKLLLAALGVLVAGVTPLFPAEPVASTRQLPRLKATGPEAALKQFQLAEGFRIELVAAEPDVMDPVSMSFDAQGRLYIIEMIGYPERRDARLGRVRRLEDLDGDGRFEKSVVFAKNLAWPTAVHCWDGGVFVLASPDLLFLRDTDEDGEADQQRVVLTGFGKGRPRLNIQGLPNSLRWGLDNRIHGVTSSNGAVLSAPGEPPLQLRGSDFSFDPRTGKVRMEMGGGQHGASFDAHGRRFVCSNSRHIQTVLYEARYAANPYFSMPSARKSIAADGDAAPVFRLSPDEPWRIVRTRWRIAGKVPGPLEGGGRVSGYFTAATGITVDRGGLFGGNNVFVADTGSNLVHRKLLSSQPDHVYPKAERSEAERVTEFLASPDNWFRPVQLANGPDGGLYILDMYREVIEHPWSLPEEIKKHLDLYSGSDRGRVWRILPDGLGRIPPPKLDGASSNRLVQALASANGWVRDTAARLLYHRQDATVVEDLLRLAADSQQSLGGLHALYALSGQDALPVSALLRALGDPSPALRQHALKLAEPNLRRGDPTLAAAVLAMTADTSLRVRFQLALTLSVVDLQGEIPVLLELYRGDHSEWLRAAVCNALSTQADALFTYCASEASVPDAIQVAIASALHSSGDSLEDLSHKPTAHLNIVAVRLAASDEVPLKLRLQALSLPLLDKKVVRRALLQFLDTEAPGLRNGAAQELLQIRPSGLSRELLARWASLSVDTRISAMDYMVHSSAGARKLISALEGGTVERDQLTRDQITTLRKLGDPALQSRAVALVGPEPVRPKPVSREQAYQRLLPALQIAGEVVRGRNIFLGRCAGCHRSGADGHALGPDVEAMKSAGPMKLLLGIVDPNREVAADFEAYEVGTSKSVHVGLLVDETPTHLTVRFPMGQSAVLRRKDVLGMKSLGRSMMPDGLESGLSTQDVADLMAFLLGD